MKKHIPYMVLVAALLLLLSGCGMSIVQIFNDIKGNPYAYHKEQAHKHK